MTKIRPEPFFPPSPRSFAHQFSSPRSISEPIPSPFPPLSESSSSSTSTTKSSSSSPLRPPTQSASASRSPPSSHPSPSQPAPKSLSPPPPLAAFQTAAVDWIDGLETSLYHVTPSCTYDLSPLLSSLSSFARGGHSDACAPSSFQWVDFNVIVRYECILLALRDGYGHVVGTGAMVYTRGEHFWVGGIEVSEAYRGLGLGRDIIKTLLTSHTRISDTTTTTTTSTNDSNRTFSLLAPCDIGDVFKSSAFIPSSTLSVTKLRGRVETSLHENMSTAADSQYHFAFINPSNIRQRKANLILALRYFSSVTHSKQRLSVLAKMARGQNARTALATDRHHGSAVLGAAWGNLHDAGKKLCIGPVVAQSIAGANAAVRALLRGVCEEVEGESENEIEVEMLALNLLPRRRHQLVWGSLMNQSQRWGDEGLGPFGEMTYMTRRGTEGLADEDDDVRDTFENGDVQERGQGSVGEMEHCDTSQYFCLSGYVG